LPAVIEVENLVKVYQGKRKVAALNGVDLEVPAGCIFGLLGPNGAGKSTLVKTLLSIVRATSGSAKLLGKDIRDASCRVSVGYLPEGHRFPRYLTGRGVCEFFGKLGGLEGEELKREVDEKLELVGMAQWADTKVGKYSKGMAQRIGLAQAMLGDPRLVFLDEPTDGVDPLGRHEIREIVKRLGASGTTIFLNSHQLAEIEVTCDQVAIMNKGRIIRRGTVAELIDGLGDSGGRFEVLFRTSHLSPAALAAVRELGEFTQGQDSFVLVLSSEGSTTGVIDVLRTHNVEIYAVSPNRADLEEAFLKILSREAEDGVGGRAT